MSSAIQRLVSYVRTDLGLEPEHQADGAGLTGRVVQSWEDGTHAPRRGRELTYLEWLEDSDEVTTWVFNAAARTGRWVLGGRRDALLIDNRWTIYCVLSRDALTWCLVYVLLDRLHHVETGRWYSYHTDLEVLASLSSRVLLYTEREAPWRRVMLPPELPADVEDVDPLEGEPENVRPLPIEEESI